MDQLLAAGDGAWRVLVTGLILGVGLPALFTVGLRQLALSDGSSTAPTRSSNPVLHRVLAYVVFAVVVLAILLGLSYIVAQGFGYAITFDGILPIIKKK
jgi:predicted secreted protein